MRYVVDVRNKTITMHIAMFWVSCFFTRPILQQKWVRNDTSPFHILMQLGKLVGFGLLNRKALQNISKISVFNFLKWKKIQISRSKWIANHKDRFSLIKKLSPFIPTVYFALLPLFLAYFLCGTLLENALHWLQNGKRQIPLRTSSGFG